MASLNKLSKPREDEKRIGESGLIEIVESDAFYVKHRFSEGNLFYFHEHGDYLRGFLISRQTDDDNTRFKQVTYKMKVREMRQDGKDYPVKGDLVVEFPGLKYLQRTIDKNELIGSLVRIVYIGRERTKWGHSAKVFDVFKDLGTYGVTSSRKESYQDGSKRKYKKRARTKPQPGGKRRAGRNAAGDTADL